MNVILVTDFSYTEGGASQVVLNTARLLLERGAKVLIVAGAGPSGPDWADLEPHVLGISGIAGGHGVGLSDAARGLWNRVASAELSRVLSRFSAKDTVVHLHTWTKVLSPSIIKVVSRSGLASAITLHDYFTICPNGGLFDYRRDGICTIKPGGIKCAATNCDSRGRGTKAYRTLRHLAQEHVAGGSAAFDGVIYVSEFSRKIHERVAIHPYSITLISPEGADKVYNVATAEPKLFIGVGRLSQEKGFLDFARASRTLGPNWELAVLGDGLQRKDIATANHRVQLPGWLEPAEVASWMSRARALVFPSKWYETYGLVVDEAARLGVPSIVSDVSAAADRVRQSGGGIVFQTSDLESLRRALHTATSPSWFESHSKKALRGYAQSTTSDERMTMLLSFYSNLIERKSCS